MGQRVLLNEMVNIGLCLLSSESRSPWAGSVQETLRAFLVKAQRDRYQGEIYTLETMLLNQNT